MAENASNEREATLMDQSTDGSPKTIARATWVVIGATALILIIGALLIGIFFKAGVNELDSNPATPSSQTTQ